MHVLFVFALFINILSYCMLWYDVLTIACFALKFIYKDTLNFYGGKHVKKRVLRDNWVFYYVNLCIKTIPLLM